MAHLIMIVLHATAAALCFIFGALTLLPHLSHHSRLTLATYYVVTLIAMIVFLAGAILAHVGQLEALQRGILQGSLSWACTCSSVVCGLALSCACSPTTGGLST